MVVAVGSLIIDVPAKNGREEDIIATLVCSTLRNRGYRYELRKMPDDTGYVIEWSGPRNKLPVLFKAGGELIHWRLGQGVPGDPNSISVKTPPLETGFWELAEESEVLALCRNQLDHGENGWERCPTGWGYSAWGAQTELSEGCPDRIAEILNAFSRGEGEPLIVVRQKALCQP